jgi:hypothetical protein
MFEFEQSDIYEFGVGDELNIMTDICRGDIITIEQEGPKKFVLRALNDDEINEYDGLKFSVDKGMETGTVNLKLVYDVETST